MYPDPVLWAQDGGHILNDLCIDLVILLIGGKKLMVTQRKPTQLQRKCKNNNKTNKNHSNPNVGIEPGTEMDNADKILIVKPETKTSDL